MKKIIESDNLQGGAIADDLFHEVMAEMKSIILDYELITQGYIDPETKARLMSDLVKRSINQTEKFKSVVTTNNYE